jgi:hypothetical protein
MLLFLFTRTNVYVKIFLERGNDNEKDYGKLWRSNIFLSDPYFMFIND